MLLFLLGIILGGIIGVLFDRIWVKFERLARVNIRSSFTFDTDWKTLGALNIQIRNVGRADIPEYTTNLWHPVLLNISMGEASSTGPLHVGQFRTHKYSRDMAERMVAIIATSGDRRGDEIAKVAAYVRENDPPYGCEFRLTMKDSDVVLFSDPIIGDAITYSFHNWGHGLIDLGYQKIHYCDNENATVFRDFLDTLWR